VLNEMHIEKPGCIPPRHRLDSRVVRSTFNQRLCPAVGVYPLQFSVTPGFAYPEEFQNTSPFLTGVAHATSNRKHTCSPVNIALRLCCSHTGCSIVRYLLTPWRRVLLEKLTGLQLIKKFPAFHGTRRFITALKSVRHLSLSWASPIQSIYPHPTSLRSILILSTHHA